MGHGNSKSKLEVTHIPHQENIENLYESLCANGILNQELFLKHFGVVCPLVADNLFANYFVDLLNPSDVTKSFFVERTHKILEIGSNSRNEQLKFYFDLLAPATKEFKMEDVLSFIVNCSKFGLLQAPDHDGKDQLVEADNVLIRGLVASCMNDESLISKEDFIKWIASNFQSLFAGFQTWLYFIFTSVKIKSTIEILVTPQECEANNVLLGDVTLWFLCCVLPSCFTSLQNKFKIKETDDFQEKESANFTWNLLYDSNQHGLSLNRFKSKVMSYKSPTVALIEFESGLLLALAVDQPWVDSAEKFGGPYCRLWELFPRMHLIEGESNMVYLKENGRSIPTGLLIGSQSTPKIQIDTDLSKVQLMYKGVTEEDIQQFEVWGCGGVEAIRSQADMKKWESNEIEKRKKVKLPGQWDADKTILEMGGVCVNHSQRGDM